MRGKAAEETARPFPTRDGVRLRHEVGDESDRWAPPVCDSRARDPLGSGRREGRGVAHSCWAVASGRAGGQARGGKEWAAAAAWAREKKKERRGRSGPSGRFLGRGRKRKINTFPILFSDLCLIRLEVNLKTFLKFKTTTQTK